MGLSAPRAFRNSGRRRRCVQYARVAQGPSVQMAAGLAGAGRALARAMPIDTAMTATVIDTTSAQAAKACKTISLRR